MFTLTTGPVPNIFHAGTYGAPVLEAGVLPDPLLTDSDYFRLPIPVRNAYLDALKAEATPKVAWCGSPAHARMTPRDRGGCLLKH